MASFIVYGDASGQVTVAAPAVAGSNTITFPAETGTLVTTATTTPLPGQIAWDTTVKTSGFTAVAYGGYFCNTTSAAFTVTLPATPTRGDFVVIVDYAGTSATNNITVSPNGGNINGSTGNIIISTNRQGLTLTYIDSTQGWLASSNVYGGATPFTQQVPISYLVVAGGAGGGSNAGGGGGAGGYLTGTATFNVGTVYTATVGGGGAGGAGGGNNAGSNGFNSVVSGTGLSTITSLGGGGGGREASPPDGNSGGSGGGGHSSGATIGAGGAGTPGQGNNGGSGATNNATYRNGGGGGGASAVGATATAGGGGNGGNGSATSISGTPATYGGGGGGGSQTVSAGGTGGTGGGGNGTGGTGGAAGVSGTANTGGGGGGGAGGLGAGGAGGSGRVVLSIPTARYSGTTTGSPTVTTSGSNTILTYTATGTYTA
jgi:hypothetical protein